MYLFHHAAQNLKNPDNRLAVLEMQKKIVQDEEKKKKIRIMLRNSYAGFKNSPSRALVQAILDNNFPLVKLLHTSMGADINAFSPDDRNTALMWSSWLKRPDIAEYLLENGADMSWKNLKNEVFLSDLLTSC